MVDAVGTTKFGYTSAGLLASENGPWTNDTVTYTYSQQFQTALNLSQPSGTWSQSYGYDSMWRMTNVVSPAGSFRLQLQLSTCVLVGYRNQLAERSEHRQQLQLFGAIDANHFE